MIPKRAIIAGPGLGAGEAAARIVLEAGYSVLSACRPELPEHFGNQLDVAAAGASPDALGLTQRVDAFIFHASPAVVAPFAQLDAEAWMRGVTEPLRAAHQWTHSMMTRMRAQRGGVIVLLGPAGGLEPDGCLVAPLVVGGALCALAEGLAYVGLRYSVCCYALRVGARPVELTGGAKPSWHQDELRAPLLKMLDGTTELLTGGSLEIGATSTTG